PRSARDLQHRGRRAGSGRGVGAVPGPLRRRRGPAGDIRLARPSAGRGVPRSPDDRRAGIIQREGEAGARLGTAVRHLAGRVPGMGEVGGVKDNGEGETGEGYAEHRPLLFSIAYRMTGSVSDAEDIVQEAFARLARVLRGG